MSYYHWAQLNGILKRSRPACLCLRCLNLFFIGPFAFATETYGTCWTLVPPALVYVTPLKQRREGEGCSSLIWAAIRAVFVISTSAFIFPPLCGLAASSLPPSFPVTDWIFFFLFFCCRSEPLNLFKCSLWRHFWQWVSANTTQLLRLCCRSPICQLCLLSRRDELWPVSPYINVEVCSHSAKIIGYDSLQNWRIWKQH